MTKPILLLSGPVGAGKSAVARELAAILPAPTARAVVSVRNIPLDYVVLRPSENVCAARAATRTEGTIADYAHYRELYQSFDGADRYTIQDDESDAAALATRIRDGLQAGTFRVP